MCRFLYTYFQGGGGGGFIKSAKRMCICDYVKNCIGTCEKYVFRFEKGYKRMNVQECQSTLLASDDTF